MNVRGNIRPLFAAALFAAAFFPAYADPLSPSGGEIQTKESGCLNGIGALCVAVGKHYEEAGDKNSAARWFEIGCDKAEDTVACAQRASLVDVPGSVRYIGKACGLSVPVSGCLTLANAAKLRRDKRAARKWYQVACERGASAGCLGRGELALESGERGGAEKWFAAACRISPEACEYRATLEKKRRHERLAARKMRLSAKAPRKEPFRVKESSWTDYLPKTMEDIVVTVVGLCLVGGLLFRYVRYR